MVDEVVVGFRVVEDEVVARLVVVDLAVALVVALVVVPALTVVTTTGRQTLSAVAEHMVSYP